MQGPIPSASFLARVRAGRIGGVVLFQNTIPHAGVRSLVAELQAAARAGGQLPLLITIDQEGGVVKRLPGPPTLAPRAMTTVAVARAQGLATGRYLHSLDIGVDLAPVLDVPASPRAFIAERAFPSSSSGVAFAEGLAAGGTAATAKHFPGLGRLVQDTDLHPGVVRASRAELARDLAPFRAAVRARVPAVLVGTAVYPAYGSRLPAACSTSIVDGLLRKTLGFDGVALSDDLDTPAVSAELAPTQAAVRAVQAGIDMVYIAGVGGSGGDAIGERAYSALLHAAQQGEISRAALQASYDRIAALKARYG